MQELSRKNEQFEIVGVSISYDDVPTIDLSQITSISDLQVLAKKLNGDKLGNIFVNYHDPVRFESSSTNLVR